MIQLKIHLLRFKKIVDIADWIESRTHDELLEIHKDMEIVLEHNFWTAVDNTQTGTMTSAMDPDNAVARFMGKRMEQ